MAARVRLFSLGLIGVALLVALLLVTGRPSSAVLYSGFAQVNTDELGLTLAIDPPVAQPGEKLTLSAVVANRRNEPGSPAITITLPPGLSADMMALPAGATFNLVSNQVTWLPVLGPGGSASLAMAVRVESVDVTAPVKDVTAVMRVQEQEHRAAAQIWLGIPPMIGGGLQQSRVSVGQSIRLQADIVGPGPITEVWKLGDGRQIDIASPVVSYAAPGEYPVELIASNPVGQVRFSSVITVVPDPVAVFSTDDDTPATNQPVAFTTASGGQPPLRYTWDFGDGAPPSNEASPVHAYTASGSYLVKLTVENSAGRSEAFAQVNVGTAPVADFMISELGTVGQSIQGQAFADASATSYTWDMGDGRAREGQLISHRYRFPGDYFVVLAVANDFGETRVGRWVRIEPGMTTVFLPSVVVSGSGSVGSLSADTTAVVALDPVVVAEDGRITVPELSFPPGTTPAEQLYSYLNEVRRQYGLQPLALNNQLNSSAGEHSRDKVRFPDDPHTGTDGTTAAERMLRAGYGAGYAGEATAWGFSQARQAVEFWMNSPSHQPMLLNRNATDVGVGYYEDYGSANIWHWTADFGSSAGRAAQPVVRLMEPGVGVSALDTDIVNYSWVWAIPPAPGQRFVVYLLNADQRIPLGIVDRPVYGSRYLLSSAAANPLALAWRPGILSLNPSWQVRLEDAIGNVLAQSESRAMLVRADMTLSPTATPTPAPTEVLPVVVTPLPELLPTATPMLPPPPPTLEPPPVLVTATPLPPELIIITATPGP